MATGLDDLMIQADSFAHVMAEAKKNKYDCIVITSDEEGKRTWTTCHQSAMHRHIKNADHIILIQKDGTTVEFSRCEG